ncbi:hypothetical protein QP968_05670 [Corynebacterium sp. MSK041]|uniref:hypothetical protein n=1 Tax=Corynebacterium sp. MSK041 TaxID=3050194 RepID=UPI00254A3E53|nr:hypothetical protein [Corynebacterium sp. MSK041]MDK8795195.1 hypothetical protein [Corynebacterium sp. MSK041]
MKDSTLVTLARGVHVSCRDSGVLQFGMDATRCGIVETQFADALRPLLAGLTTPARIHEVRTMLMGIDGFTEGAARSLIDDLVAYRILTPTATTPVAMVGSSPLAKELRALLEDSGVTVRVPLGHESDGAFLYRLAEHVPLVVVDRVAQHIAVDRQLTKQRTWNIPVVTVDARVVVGPISQGSSGPCLVCAEFYLLDRDPGLHQVATTLPDGPPSTDPVVLSAGASAAAALIRRAADVAMPPGITAGALQRGTTVAVDPFGPVPVNTEVVDKHSRCPVCAI